MTELQFEGRIAGLGSTSGVRVVVGWWWRTPWGEISDVMVEDAGGHRVLLAPDSRVAKLLEQTYVFDEVVTGPVQVVDGGRVVRVHGPDLNLGFTVGGRTLLGGLLGLVPRRLATSSRWLAMMDPAARMKGVRTKGSAGGRRTEFYGAYGLHRIDCVFGTWRGTDLGTLAPVEPPVRFGFGSTPRGPVVTSLVTTIRSKSEVAWWSRGVS